jgi:hydroxyacylglutathione hydrolase
VAKSSATIIDLRKPEAFGEAHIPGALNLGLAGNLSMWAGWLVPHDADVIFVGETEDDCREARTALARVGLNSVAGYLRGGVAEWIALGRSIGRTKQATVADVEQASDALILDVRNAAERTHVGIAGAQGISLGELPAVLPELNRAQEIMTVCGTGYRSSAAASLLQQAGFARVSHLAGGMAAWGSSFKCRSH